MKLLDELLVLLNVSIEKHVLLYKFYYLNNYFTITFLIVMLCILFSILKIFNLKRGPRLHRITKGSQWHKRKKKKKKVRKACKQQPNKASDKKPIKIMFGLGEQAILCSGNIFY